MNKKKEGLFKGASVAELYSKFGKTYHPFGGN